MTVDPTHNRPPHTPRSGAASAQHSVVVGTCDRCQGDARYVVQRGARLVVCDCPEPLVPARFFAVGMGARILHEAIRIPLEATVPHTADNGERW